MPIRQLPPLLVNQIAAGEVIERPASVAKELIENSLDAGATRIEIQIEDGGHRLIRVSDNGSGIEGCELALAVSPHATSKLTDAEQIVSIRTLGFRGEALASMASVSRMRVTSRRTAEGLTAEEGWTIEASGVEVGHPTPTAGAPGTIVEVRDLFFNTPARRKFLRNASTEIGHISDAVSRMAMVWPNVAFTLSHNGRKAIEVPANQTPRRRVLDLMGAELDEALLEFEHREGEICLWGLAGLPAVARATSKFQYFSVNHRPVRDRNLIHAVREAYRGLMPPARQPVCVLMLETGDEQVDVNVHPTKAEVRFGHPSRMHGIVLTAVRQRLLSSDLTPTVAVSSPDHQGELRADASDAASTGRSSSDRSTSASAGVANQGTFVESFQRMGPIQKGFDFDEVRRDLARDEIGLGGNPLEIEPRGESAEAMPPSTTPPTRDVLQVHKSYLVTQDEQGLLIVDQHALHERVMFEQLRHRITKHDLESQRLLMPAVIETDAKRMAILESLQPLCKKIGIEVEPMGPTTMAIQGFASFLFERRVEPLEFLEELLDRAEEGQIETDGPHVEEATLHKVLDMMACKAAVKAGDAMTPQELDALLDKRDQIERSSACPHGRPTSIRLTLRDLEKHFKRT